MARYMIDQRITQVSNLQQFDVEDYAFNEELSDADNWIFTR